MDLKPYGYVATMNRPCEDDSGLRPEQVTSYSKLRAKATAEPVWFQTNGLGDLMEAGAARLVTHSDLTDSDLSLAGNATCEHLIDRINKMFLHYMETTWVFSTLEKLLDERQRLTDAFDSLGLPVVHLSQDTHIDDESPPAVYSDASINDIRDAAIAASSALMTQTQKFMMQHYILDDTDGVRSMADALKQQILSQHNFKTLDQACATESIFAKVDDTLEAYSISANNIFRSKCNTTVSWWGKWTRSLLMQDTASPQKAITCFGPADRFFERDWKQDRTGFKMARLPDTIDTIVEEVDRLAKTFTDEACEQAQRCIQHHLQIPSSSVKIDHGQGMLEIDVNRLGSDLVQIMSRIGLQLMKKMLREGLSSAVTCSIPDVQSKSTVETCHSERAALKHQLGLIEPTTLGILKLVPGLIKDPAVRKAVEDGDAIDDIPALARNIVNDTHRY